MPDITRDEVVSYLNNIQSPELNKLFNASERLVFSISDTLEDEFQIASDLYKIFWHYAERRKALLAENDPEQILPSIY